MKALVIYEDYVPRIGIVREFRRSKTTVYDTNNIEEGLLLMSEHFPDIVVIDFYLESMTAFDFYKQIKDDFVHRPILLIIVSDLRFAILERQEAREKGIPVYYLGAFSAKELIKSHFS